MGEAKRRREAAGETVYHHTSTLRTNLLWMSGRIEVEGQEPKAFHPQLGEIGQGAGQRRAMIDFPPVVWFTSAIGVPGCLGQTSLVFIDRKGEKTEIPMTEAQSRAIMLHRVALGFRTSDIPVVPWPKHPGYDTAEGRELNRSAREAGDAPELWWIAEGPVDVLAMSEIWVAPKANQKLIRKDDYLQDVKNLVRKCRENPNIYVPPTWMRPQQARDLARRLGVGVTE